MNQLSAKVVFVTLHKMKLLLTNYLINKTIIQIFPMKWYL